MTDEGQVLDIEIPAVKAKEEEFERFSVLFRVQHIAMFVSVIMLIITGMPMKFADTAIAMAFFRAIGGVEVSGFIHRIGAGILIAVGVFHLGYIAFSADGRMNFKALLPRPKDFVDVFHNVLYFFGFRKTGARFARFSYLEKFDYWAVYWGMVVMILSGLLLWFHDQAMSLMPKVVLDIALEAHSDEALLATLAIVIWHFYNVHFNPSRFPGSLVWLHGKITKSEMLHEHPVEYEQMLAEKEALVEAMRVPGLADDNLDPAIDEQMVTETDGSDEPDVESKEEQ